MYTVILFFWAEYLLCRVSATTTFLRLACPCGVYRCILHYITWYYSICAPWLSYEEKTGLANAIKETYSCIEAWREKPSCFTFFSCTSLFLVSTNAQAQDFTVVDVFSQLGIILYWEHLGLNARWARNHAGLPCLVLHKTVYVHYGSRMPCLYYSGLGLCGV